MKKKRIRPQAIIVIGTPQAKTQAKNKMIRQQKKIGNRVGLQTTRDNG